MPLGDLALGVPFENATSYPRPGEMLLYPGGVSETEILIAYGRTNFASKAGQLAGNHFLTIVSGTEHLPRAGTADAVAGRAADRDQERLSLANALQRIGQPLENSSDLP